MREGREGHRVYGRSQSTTLNRQGPSLRTRRASVTQTPNSVSRPLTRVDYPGCTHQRPSRTLPWSVPPRQEPDPRVSSRSDKDLSDTVDVPEVWGLR